MAFTPDAFELTADEKASIIQQRLKSFNAEKFQHELNLSTAQAINSEEALMASQKAIAELNTAITAHTDVLNTLFPGNE